MARKAVSKSKSKGTPEQPPKLAVHPDAWQLARLVGVLRGKTDVALQLPARVNPNPHQGSNPVEILNALTLVFQCDLLLSNPTVTDVCNFIASNQDPGAFYSSGSEDDAERVASDSAFKKAVVVRDGQRVVQLTDIPKLVLPGKHWSKTRDTLWQRFFNERLQGNEESWGLRDDGYMDAFLAADTAADFRSFTAADRAAMSRKNRQGGAKKARQKLKTKKRGRT